jgi:hypothetical protein
MQNFENYEKYSELTAKGDWKGICDLNKVPFDAFGARKELKVLKKHLDKDEIVFAISSGIMKQTETSNSFDFGSNTWLAVVTNERLLFLDCALLTSSVDVQSIRHDRVQAVSSSQGWVLGKITVDLGSRTIVIDNCVKASVSAFADLSNRWLKARESQTKTGPVNATESSLDKLEKLGRLFAQGVLSDTEFKEAKARILAAL